MSDLSFNIRDKTHFPVFASLPEDNEVDLRYYSNPYESGILTPTKHWCLLVEIVEQVPWPIRPMFTVKDRAGRLSMVAFHLDNDAENPKVGQKHCKIGGVMAIMYANAHTFLDGQRGVRVEEMACVKFLPCSLLALLDIGDDLGKKMENVCGSCSQPASLHCSRCCVVRYCGKDCQTSDWKSRHKHNCVAIQQITDWKKRDWRKFHNFWLQ